MIKFKLNTDRVITEDGMKIVLSDKTGVIGDTHYIADPDNPGEYMVVTNTDGYNQIDGRGGSALFMLGYKLGVTGDTVVEFEPYSKLSDEVFYAKLTGDGVYKFYLIGMEYTYDMDYHDNNFESSPEVIYDTVGDVIYKKVDGVYTSVTAESLIGSEYSSEVSEFPVIVKAGTLYTELVATRLRLLMKGGCTEKELSLATKAIDDIASGVYSFTYEYCKGNKINAVKISDYLNSKDYSYVLGL